MRVLPPRMQSFSSNSFGHLYVEVDGVKDCADSQPTHFKPIFFGQQANENMDTFNTNGNINLVQIGKKVDYTIMTNMWNFYVYLSDMEDLEIQILNDGHIVGLSRVPISLRTAKEVMNPQFLGQDIILADVSHPYRFNDLRGNYVCTLNVKIWMEFDPKIHRDIKDLIDFHELVVFEGISPINSQQELPRELPQHLSILSSQISNKTQPKNNKQIKKEDQSIKTSQIYQQNIEDQSRMIQEDIDKLIMQMQSKPYDSSRYQEKDSRIGQQNEMRPPTQIFHQSMNNFAMNRNETDFSSSSHKFTRTQASLHPVSSTQHGTSPGFSRSRPVPPTPNRNRSESLGPKSIIIGEHTLTRQEQLNRRTNVNGNSWLQLKIHELQFNLCNGVPRTSLDQLIQPCYSIKVYLNDDSEQYYIAQGVKEGEVIRFNSNLKVRNIQQISKIRFHLCDDYGRVQCSGVFEMFRIVDSKKGVFIVSLPPVPKNPPKSQINISQTKVVEVSPLMRSLRIEGQIFEKVDIVQIFLKMSQVNIPFSLLRYKVPLTKQTIQHTSGSSHVNIFPHNCSPQTADVIILQFWRNEEMIGQSQLSLKNIKNTNLSALSANLDPNYLYDGKKFIKDLFDDDRVVGNFSLTLCFGTVKQMQSLLLQTIEQEKSSIKEIERIKKTNATFDERLGVIVTNAHVNKNQISVQVEIEDENRNIINQSAKFNQLSFGDQSMISHASQNQFMNDSLVSFSKTPHQEEEQIRSQPKQEKVNSQKYLMTKVEKLPTVSQTICQQIKTLLEPITAEISNIKELCKPHLLFNFIECGILKQIFLKVGLNNKTIEKIFKLVLFAKEGMINVNFMCDLCASIQIDGFIKTHLLSQDMFLVGAMRQAYQNQVHRKTILLESQMQFKQMSDVFKRIGLKLTLHEYEILNKFLSIYKTKEDCQNLKSAVVHEIESQIMQEMKQGFYQQDILKQIYGDESSSLQSLNSSLSQPQQQNENISFNEISEPLKPKFQKKQVAKMQITNKVQTSVSNASVRSSSFSKEPVSRPRSLSKSPKAISSQKFSIHIEGTEKVLESASCIFDDLPANTYFRVVIEEPVFEELIYKGAELCKQFEATSDLKDADGRIDFVGDGKVLACAAFSLIKGLESFYPIKTKEGAFCGLIKIRLE